MAESFLVVECEWIQCSRRPRPAQPLMASAPPVRSTLRVDASRLRKAFGSVVRRRRAAAGLTQEALAHAAGLSVTFVSLVENGHKSPTILVARQLAHALGTTGAALVTDWERESGRGGKK